MTRSLSTLLRLQSVHDAVVPFTQHGGQQIQPAMTGLPVKVQLGFQKAAAYHGQETLQSAICVFQGVSFSSHPDSVRDGGLGVRSAAPFALTASAGVLASC
jgi:hypothetical protein